MIIVKIELHPASGGPVRKIGEMHISNDGKGTATRGDYRVEVFRRGSHIVNREGEVKGYPRTAYNVWRLIARAILSAFPEELESTLARKRRRR